MQIGNQHLDSERVAAFDHDPPTATELAHLASCAVCRAERHAFTALSTLSQRMAERNSSASHITPRLVEWDVLADGLRREGLMVSPESVASARLQAETATTRNAQNIATAKPRLARRAGVLWLRSAAAVFLVVGGVIGGRVSAGASGWSLGAARNADASATAAASVGDNFVSVQQATDMLYTAQRDYERASLWLAGNDSTTQNSDVYRARLAALDQMMTASRAALRDAPQDPVLNHYFLTAYTAREATLKQLSAALPVNKTLERY